LKKVLFIILISLISNLFAGELNFDERIINISEILFYPQMPSEPDKVNKKIEEQACEKVKMEHYADVSDDTTFASDINAPLSSYTITVIYYSWDYSIKSLYRDINSKMIIEPEKSSMIEQYISDYNKSEKFYISFDFPDAYSYDVDINNYNIIMFDDKGNRCDTTSISELGFTAHHIGDTLYDCKGYLVEFPKLDENKTKVEIVIAGGSQDKKLGFRWIFQQGSGN